MFRLWLWINWYNYFQSKDFDLFKRTLRNLWWFFDPKLTQNCVKLGNKYQCISWYAIFCEYNINLNHLKVTQLLTLWNQIIQHKVIFFIIWHPGDKNLRRYNFPWIFLLGLSLGENQDPKKECKQKTALLQNCSSLVIFLAIFEVD